MKTPICILALSVLSLCLHAQDSTRDTRPWDYIMMKHGQLIEVMKGRQKPVTADVTLVNESTIHTNGMINVSSGRTRQLKEGEYLTMDGRIRKLRDMPRNLAVE